MKSEADGYRSETHEGSAEQTIGNLIYSFKHSNLILKWLKTQQDAILQTKIWSNLPN